MSSYRSPPPMATTRSWASAAASASAGAACPATQAVEISASGQVCSAVVRADVRIDSARRSLATPRSA